MAGGDGGSAGGSGRWLSGLRSGEWLYVVLVCMCSVTCVVAVVFSV